ncbi:two-component sensor histidine kinase [Planotetraspora thailandica]|uniref:histidine kinase n=1 Tax=Planotetraspora thailandica TaxID=487172 RepID=A0A8J3Y0X2_9ACTN|nr:ATP-binding protein [Planotetraspora thailandica]GII58779.1 two-component sensor histidine kinase [Planotetraspora thailandica]
MSGKLRHQSIQARYTFATAITSLILFLVIGAGLDWAIRTRIQNDIFYEAERVAATWIGSFPVSTSPPAHRGRIDLLQLVDDAGRVEAASDAVAGRPPIGTSRPPVNDRIAYGTECSDANGCVVLTTVRVSPLETRVLWKGRPHYIYAGMAQPPLLSSHALELLTSAGVLLAVGLSAWATWCVVGRTLRPVEMIRARTAEITVSDLSMRVPEPPGSDEIAQLARTANRTLSRLETAVEQQRQFASTVSYELRTPVADLHTELGEALQRPCDAGALVTIRSALSTTQRLQTIIDDLLVLARIRSAPAAAPEAVDLGALVTEEAARRSRADTPIRTRYVDPGAGEAVVLGNRVQLIGVMTNLIANAQRHAATGVQVTVGRSGDQAVVTVSDDGDGIAPQDRERVFEPFVRLGEGQRRDPDGTGLGLAICRAVASAHNGTIEIEDSPRGARFVVRLPILTP